MPCDNQTVEENRICLEKFKPKGKPAKWHKCMVLHVEKGEKLSANRTNCFVSLRCCHSRRYFTFCPSLFSGKDVKELKAAKMDSAGKEVFDHMVAQWLGRLEEASKIHLTMSDVCVLNLTCFLFLCFICRRKAGLVRVAALLSQSRRKKVGQNDRTTRCVKSVLTNP